MRHGKLSTAAATVALVLGLAFGVAADAATLTGMTVSAEGEVTRIHVTLDEPVEISHFTLTDPPRLFIDCRGVDQVIPQTLPNGEGRAGNIEASVWVGDGEHALTRIAIDLARPSKATVSQVDDGLMVELAPDKAGSWTHETPLPSDEQPAETPGQVMDREGTMTAPTADSAGAGDAAPDADAEIPSWENSTVSVDEDGVADSAPETEAPVEDNTYEDYEYELPANDYAEGYKRTTPTVSETIGMSKQSGLSGRGGSRVSLDIQGADIYTVLRSISEYAGVNIVMGFDVSTEVNRPLSFHLNDVPWGEALEMVLRSASLWYREENGIIRVDTEENLRNEDLARGTAARQLEEIMPLSTRIVQVVYATAYEMKPAIEKALSRRGVVEVDDRTNALVVTDIASRLEAAVEMIQHLDSQTPQIEIVAKLVDVDTRFTRELGVLWTGSWTDQGSSGLSGDGLAGSNSILDPTGRVRMGLVRSWGSVNAVLSALEQDNKANIISNPRITTVNNREARILVGKKIPLIVLDEAGNPVTELTTIGITLRVTPHINDNNRITMDLHPEVSDLASQATVQGGIIINTSEADTRVMVDNGQTAVIGGLIRSNVSQIERGVPILKDIPLLGSFFKSTSDVKEKRELLIFVTPRIINNFAANGGE